jgi:clan AA aspartic protease (TIGR02281 family)
VVKAQRHIAALEAKTKALKEQQIEERKLATKATSTRKYNAHIRTANECSTQHNALLKEVATAKKQLSHTQSSLNGYATQALHLRNDYQERYNTFMENGRRPEFQGYFDYIHQKLAKHQDALETGFQAFSGNAMVVRAHLNNKVSGNFIVDTGATMVLLHRGLAEKLGLDLTGEEIKATLADGTTQRMPSVNLQSVSVNGMTAFNVFGAVSDVPPGKGVDGLLGMSFLSQFEFRLDTQNGRLVLHPRR